MADHPCTNSSNFMLLHADIERYNVSCLKNSENLTSYSSRGHPIMLHLPISHTNPKPPIQTRFFYGWMMVLISGIGIFFSGPGQTFTNSVFIESYIHDFHMSQTSIAGVYSAATLLSGLFLFFVGRLVDRLGRRVMLTATSLLLAVSCFYNSMAMGPVTLFIGFFLIRYFGQGSMTLIPNTLVSQWFVKYRGRALSFAAIGGLLGAATFPPVSNMLIDTFGWQHTWRIFGVVILLVFVPLAFYFVRNNPEDVGLFPDGKSASQDLSMLKPEIREDSWNVGEALRTRSFWFVLICGAIPAMVNTGITFQIFSILGSQGIDRVTTAFVLSLVPLISFGCSLLSGFMVERMRANRLLSFAFILSMLSPLILIAADSYAVVLVFAVTWGIAQGFMNIPLGVIWPNYFGRKHLGSIQSITHTAMVIGSALGPLQFGWALDHFGNYKMILLISAGIWAVGAVLAYLASPPIRKINLG
ncbi:MFS transporter [Paenibacillus sp. TRM 82003]|nr:MFS transporter [Paenibacillus sp. TRM 82003]